MTRERFLLACITIQLVCIQVMFWLIFLNQKNLPPQIPLFYVFATPEKVLAPVEYFWILPSLGGLVLALNVLLGKYLLPKDPFLAKLTLGVCSAVCVLLTLSTIQILRGVLY